MLIGTCFLWLIATQRWASSDDLTIAVCAALASVFIAARLGGVGGSFARAPEMALLALARAGPVLRGALAAARAAFAADVTLKPALVRVKTRASRAAERAAFANLISATPGLAVVDTDSDGLLVHVTNEDAIDAADLGRLEHLVMKGGSQA
jgi:multicomponent Na+:H+ antiporter subunit E